MTDQPTFVDRQRDAALAEIRRISHRDRAVANIIRGSDPDRVTEIVAIEDGDGHTTGAFVAEVETSTLGTIWQAVNNGGRLTCGWYSRPLAVLHLLAARYGDTSSAEAATYAARVLGIDDGEQ